MFDIVERINKLIKFNKTKIKGNINHIFYEVPKEKHEIEPLDLYGIVNSSGWLDQTSVGHSKEIVFNSQPHTWWLDNPDARVVKLKLVEDKENE